MTNANHMDNIYASATGALSPLFATLIGWIDLSSIASVAISAAVGTVVGFTLNRALRWLFSKIFNSKSNDQ